MLTILNSRVPSGDFGRALTSAERSSIRSAGYSVSNRAIVIQNRADYLGIVYNPTHGYGRTYAHSGILVRCRD